MKFNEVVLSTIDSIAIYETEINSLSSGGHAFVFDLSTSIDIAFSGAGIEYKLYMDNLLVDRGRIDNNTIITPDTDYCNKLEIYDGETLIERYLVEREYITVIDGTMGTGRPIKLSSITVKITTAGTWANKIDVAKNMIESRLNVILKNYRSRVNPDPVLLINNAEILSLSSDLLVIHLIYRDLSLGDESVYGNKAEMYYDDFKTEFDSVTKALDLDLSDNDTTDLYGYTQNNLLTRKTVTRGLIYEY